MARSVESLIREGRLAYLGAAAVSRSGVGDFSILVDCVREAYLAHNRSDVVLTKAEYLKYRGRPSYDRIIPLLGYLGGEFKLAGLKQICSAVGNSSVGFPRASGLIILNDPITSRPYAILEASLISAARTAAVTALALRELTWPALSRVAIIGCGLLAQTHLRMLAQLFGQKRFELRLYDVVSERAQSMLKLADSLALTAEASDSAQQAIEWADIVMPMTTAERGYVRNAWLKDKSFYCAVSLLDAELEIYRTADLIVVDNLEQCMHEGRPLERLNKRGELNSDRVVEIGAILDGAKSSWKGEGRVVFNPMGTVITDLAVASVIFERAIETEDFVCLEV